jgi:hypothetical protein
MRYEGHGCDNERDVGCLSHLWHAPYTTDNADSATRGASLRSAALRLLDLSQEQRPKNFDLDYDVVAEAVSSSAVEQPVLTGKSSYLRQSFECRVYCK